MLFQCVLQPGLPTRRCRAAAASLLCRPAGPARMLDSPVPAALFCSSSLALFLIRPHEQPGKRAGGQSQPGAEVHSEASSRGDRVMPASCPAWVRGSLNLPPSFPMLLVFAAGLMPVAPRASEMPG